MREARAAIGRNRSLSVEGEAHAELVKFFKDVFQNIAQNAGKNRRAADLYVIRSVLEACRSTVGASSFTELYQQLELDLLKREQRGADGEQLGIDDEIARLQAQIEQSMALLEQRIGSAESAPGEKELWKFPVILKPDIDAGQRFDGEFREFSALKMFGYTVGKTKGWDQRERQSFLSDFMEMRLPKDVEEVFGDEYGEPMSSGRLRKVANLIAKNAQNAYRRDASSMKNAIEDWEDDLAFLKKKYFFEAKLRFEPWPASKSS